MRILVDSHCWLWWLFEPERLGERARDAFAEQRDPLYLSAASAWEISIKTALGKLRLPQPAHEFVPRALAEQGMQALPVTLPHALHVERLPALHDDPFDRVLVAQAQLERCVLLTADPQVAQYDVEVLWAGPGRRPAVRRRASRRPAR